MATHLIGRNRPNSSGNSPLDIAVDSEASGVVNALFALGATPTGTIGWQEHVLVQGPMVQGRFSEFSTINDFTLALKDIWWESRPAVRPSSRSTYRR
ncbi:hypothetical protein SAMN06309944_0853 [Micrococcales bacterium KH10]|nr:hypothetical protein SAMN06309944_0853 [Micrococcales bacterium KH10]